MKLRSIVLSVLMGGLGLPAMAQEPAGPWHQSYESAHQAACQLKLPLLLHFYADWCGPCRRMEKNVLNSADVLAHLGTGIVAVRINVDQDPELAERFGVSGLPADVMLSPDGAVVMNRRGYVESDEYVALLRSHTAPTCGVQPVAALDEPESHDAAPGLKGFSPVSITRDRAWRKGDSRYEWTYRGVVYHLVDADELELFMAEPHRYVPRLQGYDPLLLATANRRALGDIRFGAFYNDGLYLHSSQENRRLFIESPTQYIDQAESLLSIEAEALSMLPAAR